MSASKDSLPELPPLGVSIGGTLLKGFSVGDEHADAYSAEAIRAYGLACYQAGLERAAEEAERIRDLYDQVSARDMIAMGNEIAAAIRSEKAIPPQPEHRP